MDPNLDDLIKYKFLEAALLIDMKWYSNSFHYQSYTRISETPNTCLAS